MEQTKGRQIDLANWPDDYDPSMVTELLNYARELERKAALAPSVMGREEIVSRLPQPDREELSQNERDGIRLRCKESYQLIVELNSGNNRGAIEVFIDLLERELIQALQLRTPDNAAAPVVPSEDEIAGIMYANPTDSGDYESWIEARDFHKVARLIRALLTERTGTEEKL